MKKYFLIAILSLTAFAGSYAQQKSSAEKPRVVIINKADGTTETLLMSDVERITFGFADDVVENPAVAEAIDMGVSVKWASFNLGATGTTKETCQGFLVGWGDNTAQNKSENLNFYPKNEAPATIINTEYDLAHVMWGEEWRLPTDAEFNELIAACEWTWDEDRQGYQATAANNNTLFFPATGYRVGYKMVEAEALNGFYWTGQLSKQNEYALAAKICEADGGSTTVVLDQLKRCYGLAIRPVYGEYVIPLSVSAAIDGKPSYTEADIAVTFDGNSVGVTKYGVAWKEYEPGKGISISVANKVEHSGAPTKETMVLSLSDLDDNTNYEAVAYAVLGEDTLKSSSVVFTTDSRYVDLGLSVKWAKWNIGAESENEYGGYYGWGDPTGTVASPYESYYATGNTSTNIGGTKYDIATAKWGKHWRLPTRAEFEELFAASGRWEYSNNDGFQKYIATLPNGEKLEIPIYGYMTSTLSEVAHTTQGYYWTSEATSEQSPYALHIGGPRSRDFQNSPKSLHLFIRPVYVEDPVESEDDDPSNPETAEAGTAIDLGLPSGTLWANFNVGAKNETQAGMYVAWGELKEKISEGYHKENYLYWSAESTQYSGYSAALGTDIAGTEYDIAHVRWKGDWQMPTDADFEELKYECNWTEKTKSGVFGFQVTGPNGNSIFLPCQGYYNGNNLYKKNDEGWYWSSRIYLFSDIYTMANSLIIKKGENAAVSWSSRKSGLTVRPVKHKKK
ncbi:MAG: hypothetical protein SPL55_06675 [Prevotella sp.]|nr:hypothetical protein [Prevotella sp.]